jgi:hypothetical protein
MLQAAITFASVILASSIAYLTALAAWRRQQRREVYGAYIAAVDDTLESLDVLLAEPSDMRVRELGQWEEFHDARHRFDMAWGQVRLVAPAKIADHARSTGYALLNFERDARDLSVEQARSLRVTNEYLTWDQAYGFVLTARKTCELIPNSGQKAARRELQILTVHAATRTHSDPQLRCCSHSTAG